MRSYKVFIAYFLFNWAVVQGQEIKVSPKVESLSLDEGEVTLVHLTPGYATAVRMPAEISSVVVGDPANVFLHVDNQQAVDISRCDGANCGQPSLSGDGRWMVFVRMATE